LLARKSILVTLLTACGHESARAAFTQVEDIGERWFRELFEGIANYVRGLRSTQAAFCSGELETR
jgi:hypothetical protein